MKNKHFASESPTTESLENKQTQPSSGKKRYDTADVFKFVGLIVFFAIMGLVVVFIWPYIADLFTPGGVDRVLDEVRNAGAAGVLVLLGLQFLQIVVAFIPGEFTQMAAGILYGPWLGALIILTGCIISSAFIYLLVHKLGAPFVQGVVPVKQLEKFRTFEKTGKLNIIVFILFLIPGLPKDVFTYLIPLTDMRLREFMVLSNLGRIPGILVSTYAASGLAEGRYLESIIIFAVGAVVAVLGLVFQKRLISITEKLTGHSKKQNERNSPEEEKDSDKVR